MKLLELYSKYAPNKIFIAILSGAISGVASALFIPVVMTALASVSNGLSIASGQQYQIFGVDVAHPKFAGVYLGIIFIILLTRTISHALLTKISLEATTKLRQDLYKQIANASISSLEQCSSGRLIQCMTSDVNEIVRGAGLIPDLLILSATLSGLLVYLYCLNDHVFGFVLCVVFFGAITYQFPVLIGTEYFKRSRKHMDILQEGFRGLAEGAKELKLNKIKHEHFMDNQLLLHESHVLKLSKIGGYIILAARNYGDLINLISMGLIAFVYINYHPMSTMELTGVLMVCLYIGGPAAGILSIWPDLARSKVALNRVQSLFNDLPSEEANSELHPVPEWKSIKLKSIFYQHPNSGGDHSFSVGPIDTHIKQGEITFIVGGNGSGKSTLAKIISLHYSPTSGGITFDDVLVTKENINSYRQQIACIYSDYYLFKQLHSEVAKKAEDPELLAQVDFYLEVLELKGKVELRDGHFTTLHLSDGQRRRLALLVAFLDNRALYVFDEWAADQDPEFKRIFYYDILPNLKAQGKSVIAISHDDRYFDVADNILIMENGKLVDNYKYVAIQKSPPLADTLQSQ